MSQRMIRPTGSRRTGATMTYVVLGGLALVIAACLAVAFSATPPFPVTFGVSATDGSGAPLAVPVRIDGELVGTTPIELRDFWIFDESDLVAPVGEWPPPLDPTARAASGIGLGAGSERIDLHPYETQDGATVVLVRFERGGRVIDRDIRLEVGEPGSYLRPVGRGGGITSGLLSSSANARLDFVRR